MTASGSGGTVNHAEATAALEHAPFGYLILDRSWRCLYVNRAAGQLLAEPGAALAGEVLWEAVPALVDTPTFHCCHRAIERREAQSCTDHLASRDVWFSARAFPIPEGLGVSFEDVTERVVAERALRESEERLRTVLGSFDAGFWDIDLATRSAVISPRALELLGLALHARPSLEEVLALVHPDDRGPIRALVTPGHEGDPPFHREARIRRADDGRERWIRVQGRTLLDQTARAVRTVGTVLDVTDQVRARAAVDELQLQLAEGQRLASVGSWSWDIASNKVVWSDETYRLLDTPKGAPLSLEMVLAMAPEPSDAAKTQFEIARAMGGEPPRSYETRIRRRDGAIRHFLNSFKIDRDESGKPTRMIGVFQDITDAKQAEQEREDLRRRVQHAQKLESLGVLAGGVAHDFNNLLVGILTNASLVLDDVPATATNLREPLEDIERAGQRASELTRQLLAYSGRARFVIEPVNLSDLAREMTQLLHAALQPGARLTLELAADLPAVVGDATQLRQVVMNLITNAADALEGRAGQITVRTTRAADVQPLTSAVEFHDGASPAAPGVVLEVIDTGAGMEPATVQRIFDPFFTTKFTGRGLGLAAALGIVRSHQGSIAVASAPGKGSTFRLQFPALETEPGPAAVVQRQSVKRAKSDRLVLVVDDDSAVSAVVERSLQRLGCRVTLAPGGSEALALLRGGLSPDLVLLDLTMPGLGGREVLATLAIERPELPVVLTSGYSESELLEATQPRPAGFLSKPFTLDELDAVLRLARP